MCAGGCPYKRIALNRVSGESDVGHQRDVPGVAQIECQTRSRPRLSLVCLRHKSELLNGEIFTTLKEAQIVIVGWHQLYNCVHPYSSLGYEPPVPESVAWPASPAVESAPPTMASRSTLN